jgi:hypothetical protein
MTGPTPDDADIDATELPFEAPEADVAEQHTPARPEPSDALPADLPADADPADVAEQRREVGLGDDEYA